MVYNIGHYYYGFEEWVIKTMDPLIFDAHHQYADRKFNLFSLEFKWWVMHTNSSAQCKKMVSWQGETVTRDSLFFFFKVAFKVEELKSVGFKAEFIDLWANRIIAQGASAYSNYLAFSTIVDMFVRNASPVSNSTSPEPRTPVIRLRIEDVKAKDLLGHGILSYMTGRSRPQIRVWVFLYFFNLIWDVSDLNSMSAIKHNDKNKKHHYWIYDMSCSILGPAQMSDSSSTVLIGIK